MKPQSHRAALILILLAIVAGTACQGDLASASPTPITVPSAGPSTSTKQVPTPTASPLPFIPATIVSGLPEPASVAEICEAAATLTVPVVEPSLAAPTAPPVFTMTPMPPPMRPVSNPSLIGEPVPLPPEQITAVNYRRLQQVAQWGRGNILGVAFTPDGGSFVVGSEMGLAVYDRDAPETQPQWIPLHSPFYYESLYFDEAGAYILLEGPRGSQIRTFPGGELRPDATPGKWLRSTSLGEGWGKMNVSAPDGGKRLVSHTDYIKESSSEKSVRQVIDAATGELLYELADGTVYVQYGEWHEPEGCDLTSFSMCGNAYDPSALHPYRAGFSPGSDYLAILYRAPNLWNAAQFGRLRVYSAQDGQLRNVIGNADQPVTTFAFSPDGVTLLVGYQSGAAHLWDMGSGADVFGAWHFNAPLVDLDFSPGGSYLVLQRPDWVEVRRTHDGTLLGRYPANAFALSPRGDILALGGRDGVLTLKDLNGLQDVHRISAHEGPILALAFSPDGQTVVSSGQDCAVKSWDATTAVFSHQLAENVTDAYGFDSTASRIFVHALGFVPDGGQLLGYGSWSRVVSWDAASGATRYLIEPEPLPYYQGMITLDPHFPEFLSVDEASGRLFVGNASYDLITGESVDAYQPPPNLPAGCALAGPLTADGALQLTLGYEDREGQICLLNAADHSLVEAVEIFATGDPNTATIAWLYLSPQGERLIVTTGSGVVLVYQVGPG